MGKKIHTVLGPVLPEKLGFTQCHEHLMLSKGASYQCNPALWMDDIEASVKEAAAYREMGGAALVEAQPGGCGRMAEELKEISILPHGRLPLQVIDHCRLPISFYDHLMIPSDEGDVF